MPFLFYYWIFLRHVKQFGERNRNGRVIRIGLHDIGHIIPPFLHDRGRSQILRGLLAFDFLHGKQNIRLLVPEDRIVVYVGIFQHLDQFGPDFGVAFLVLGLATGFQFHFECTSLHGSISFRLS